MPKRLDAGWLLILCLWAMGTASSNEALGPERLQRQAPPLQLQDLQGNARSLADYRGQVVLVNFWASWCGPCITEMPSLRALYLEMQGQPFEILAVNVEEGRFKVHKFSRLVEMPFPILLDTEGDAFAAWRAEVLPTSFIVDADGRVRHKVHGSLDWTSAEVLQTIRSLLPAMSPSLTSLPAYRPPPISGSPAD